MPGPQGPKGDIGPRGPSPDAGVDGSKINALIFCTGNLQGNENVWFDYKVVQFANGNIFVNGSIREGEIQASKADVFAPQQNGYTNAPVLIAYDLAGASNGGYWAISLTAPRW